MSEPSPLRKALYEAMAKDATLVALLKTPTSIFHRDAPENAHPPYIIFRQHAGRRQWAFQGGQIRWPLWLIKAVDRGASSNTAEAIDERIDTILTDATLVIPGFDHLDIRRELDMPEPAPGESGEILHEVGGYYRIALSPV